MGSAEPAEAPSARLLLVHFSHLGRILDALGRFLVVIFRFWELLGASWVPFSLQVAF